MKNNIKLIIIACFLLALLSCTLFTGCTASADASATYQRNSLLWENAVTADDGSAEIALQNGTATLELKNDVPGRIGYSIYLYSSKALTAPTLSADGATKINDGLTPEFSGNYSVMSAYGGYLEGNSSRTVTLTSEGDDKLTLMIIIEDNNSYPKENEETPTFASAKIKAEVLLDGQYARGSDYQFSLKDESGNVIETVHNDDGYISFSSISIAEKGAYIYYLSQDEGNDKKITYDDAVYKITVTAEEKNVASLSYEKDGVSKQALPRFSNYKDFSYGDDEKHTAEYPTNEKKVSGHPNYLLISALAIGLLIIILYVVKGRKKD